MRSAYEHIVGSFGMSRLFWQFWHMNISWGRSGCIWKSTKNHTKINQKSTKNPSKVGSWRFLGPLVGLLEGSWVDLGLKSQQNVQKADSLGPPGPRKLDPKSTKKVLKFDPEAFQKVVIFLIACVVRFWCYLVPTWFQLGHQNPPKIDPSCFQNPSKKGSRC